MLDILEDARRYPGMYIGSTNDDGVQVLPRCLINHAIDAYLAGRGSTISVVLQSDGGIQVTNDAISLPVSLATVSAPPRDLFL